MTMIPYILLHYCVIKTQCLKMNECICNNELNLTKLFSAKAISQKVKLQRHVKKK